MPVRAVSMTYGSGFACPWTASGRGFPTKLQILAKGSTIGTRQSPASDCDSEMMRLLSASADTLKTGARRSGKEAVARAALALVMALDSQLCFFIDG